MNNYNICFKTTQMKWLGKPAIEEIARSLCILSYPSQSHLNNQKKRPHRIMKIFIFSWLHTRVLEAVFPCNASGLWSVKIRYYMLPDNRRGKSIDTRLQRL